jgi:hypothetical protein
METPHRIGHPETDGLIQAYEILNVDIVKVIVEKKQLVDFGFIKKRYKKLQLQYHPDISKGSSEQSANLNVSYEKIKKLMANSDAQSDMLKRILLFYSETKSNVSAYFLLFITEEQLPP